MCHLAPGRIRSVIVTGCRCYFSGVFFFFFLLKEQKKLKQSMSCVWDQTRENTNLSVSNLWTRKRNNVWLVQHDEVWCWPVGIGDSKWGSIRRGNLILEVGCADKEHWEAAVEISELSKAPWSEQNRHMEKNGFDPHFSKLWFHRSEEQLQTGHKNREMLPVFVPYLRWETLGECQGELIAVWGDGCAKKRKGGA